MGCFPASVQESQASVPHMSGCRPYLCIQPLGAQPAREVFTLQHTCPAQGPRGAGGVKSPRNCQYQAASEVPSLCRFQVGTEAECLRAEADRRQPVLSPGERRAWGSCSATWVGRELQSGVRPQALPLVELCSPSMVMWPLSLRVLCQVAVVATPPGRHSTEARGSLVHLSLQEDGAC